MALTKIPASMISGLLASMVSFVQTGVGAVSRAIQDKLTDTVSVFDFMTAAQVADVRSLAGLVDVAPALQLAINRGGRLRVPRGVYRLNSTLDLRGKSALLIGEGEDRTVFRSTFAGVMLDVQETVDQALLPLAVQHIKLDGAGIATSGIKTRYRHKTDLSNLTIVNVLGDALNELDSWNNTRSNLTLNNNVNGLVVAGAGNNCAYNGISLSGNTQYQIKIMNGGTVPGGSTSLSFNQCDVEYATGFGIYVNTIGVVRFNDCYLGENIQGTVFDMAGGTVIMSGGFAWFGATAVSYLGNLGGGKLLFRGVNITGGVFATVANMFISGGGRANIEDSPCYVTASGTQVMSGDTLGYGRGYDTFAPKLGRLYTGFCLNGTFSSASTANEITVTCLTATASPCLLEVHANVTPNWVTGAPGALVVVYKSTQSCTARLTASPVGNTPAISILDTLPATGGAVKTAVMFNWTLTKGVYPSMLEIFQNNTVVGDSLTVYEVFFTDSRSTKPDASGTFYNLGKC